MPLSNILTPNYFVAASSLLDILTLGLRYDASILKFEPMAPFSVKNIYIPQFPNQHEVQNLD